MLWAKSILERRKKERERDGQRKEEGGIFLARYYMSRTRKTVFVGKARNAKVLIGERRDAGAKRGKAACATRGEEANGDGSG